VSLHIRAARAADHAAITGIIVPTIRAGETYALDRDLGEAEALAYWTGPDRETFVAEEAGTVLGAGAVKADAALHRGPRHRR